MTLIPDEPPSEVPVKLARVRRLLAATGRSAAVFATPGSFAWLTGGGRNHVSLAGDAGVGVIVVDPQAAYVVADNIELARLCEEERSGPPFEPVEYDWWSGNLDAATAGLAGADPVTDAAGFGTPLSPADLMTLRNPLLPAEIERYQRLGEDVGIALTHAAFHCRPGFSERQVSGLMAGTAMDLGIDPLVSLCAVDERIARRRHPLPTGQRLERCALLILTGRRHGLHVSASRMVHFGAVPDDLRRRHAACAAVDAAFLDATRPGRSLADVFRAGQAAYAAAGYADEWRRHHQGGPTGYAARDLKATPEIACPVRDRQAFAWNPTLAGTKSEDTVLVAGECIEVLSLTPDLPMLEHGPVARPAILER